MINPETLEDLPLLTIMVGLQGSGKSTKAKEIANIDNAIILSSDEYRKMHPEWNNESVFKNLYLDMNKYLRENKDVIIDATNVTIKSRKKIFDNLKVNCIKKCLIINTPFDICKQRVIERNKTNQQAQVPLEVLDNYLKSFEIPFEEEGFDYILINEHPEEKDSLEYQNQLMLIAKTFDQQNMHHTKNLFDHMNDVGCNIAKNISGRSINKGNLRLLALSGYYHDIGKLFTQIFKENDPNAHYYNHANVGAYYLLCRCGVYIHDSLFEDDDIIQYSESMTLNWLFYINYHMHMYNLNSEKSINKWKKIFGEFKFSMLEILNKADKGEH